MLATHWNDGLSLCELKSGCSSQKQHVTNRVKCCLPGAAGDDGCAGQPGPPPPVCDKAALPVFCDHSKPIDERVRSCCLL